MSLEEMEKRHILATLEKNRGNRTVTAQELGISFRNSIIGWVSISAEGTFPPA